MSRPLDILVIEDQPADFMLLERHLNHHGVSVSCQRIDSNAQLEVALHRHWDLILSDYNVPGMDIRVSLKTIRRQHPNLPVILVSGTVGDETAVELLKQGLNDFIIKDRLGRLADAIQRAIALANEHIARQLAETALINSEEQYRQLFESSRDALMLVQAPLGVICRANRAALLLFGAGSEADLTSVEPWKFSPAHQPDGRLSREKAEAILAMTLRDGSSLFEWEHQRFNGENFSADVLLTTLEFGNETLIQATVRDITERKNADVDMRIAATIFKSQQGMLVTDANNVILRVNEAFTVITGYTSEEVIGENPRILSSGLQGPDFYKAMWATIQALGSWDGEIWNKRKNGEIFPEHMTITAVKNREGCITNYVATLTDITMDKQAADEIKNLAFYDPLTHLPNRRLLQDRLNQALAYSERSGKSGAVLFIDLDNFKIINDTHGHARGDQLLQQVAERLTTCVREGDTVARIGGDEFVLILEDLSANPIESAAQAESVGAKIMDTLNQPYCFDNQEYFNTTSVGITLFKGHDLAYEELFKQSDIAMYQAKSNGRNTICFFDPRMQDVINARSLLEAALRTAISRNQFVLYYQIQVDLHLKPFGAEALIRWKSADHKLISPAEFIPIAEDTGLILPIGKWVLETACQQLRQWQLDPATRNLILSVNVSARQFRHANFVTEVLEIITGSGIDPTRLKLELTESILLDNVESIIKTMSALTSMGVRFSLDDFGTGYSSLQYLKQLPLHQLKIDQSFVRDLAKSSNDRAIVNTIIAMANSLNLDVIAEGVETQEQRQFLEDAGCVHYQGYLFGSPVPIHEFQARINSGVS